MPDVVFARDGALLYLDNGLPYRIQKGQAWKRDDPLVKRWPEFFVAEPDVFRTDGPPIQPGEDVVERAVQAPGRKRQYIRRAPREASQGSW